MHYLHVWNYHNLILKKGSWRWLINFFSLLGHVWVLSTLQLAEVMWLSLSQWQMDRCWLTLPSDVHRCPNLILLQQLDVQHHGTHFQKLVEGAPDGRSFFSKLILPPGRIVPLAAHRGTNAHHVSVIATSSTLTILQIKSGEVGTKLQSWVQISADINSYFWSRYELIFGIFFHLF